MTWPTCALRRPGQARRTARLFGAHLLGAFGAAAAAIQFLGPVLPAAFADPGRWTLAAFGPCLVWAGFRARPLTRVRQEFSRPGMTVVIESGDLFDRPEHLVVGFSDTFDTEVGRDGTVSASSVQGQLLERLFRGENGRLDWVLAKALRETRPVAWERREDKPHGKLRRYPIGTVAVLEHADAASGRVPQPQLGPGLGSGLGLGLGLGSGLGSGPEGESGERRLVFAVAYSRLGNDGVARSSVEELWLGLNRLWDSVYRRGQQDALAVPLLGAGLARLDFLEAQDILRLILLSFVTRSRERRVCRELRVVVRTEDLDRIDLPGAAVFLKSLGAAADH